MVNLDWCKQQKNGIELVNPNENVSKSYLEMAEKTMEDLLNAKTAIWKASMTYYAYYYCLYSIMIRIGIKCEIHSCSLEFMKECLKDYYSKEEMSLVVRAFDLRNRVQYYPQEKSNTSEIEFLKNNVGDFFVKTKDILIKMKESDIIKIRSLI